jgi:DNA mismatch repair ATPase MutS
MIPIVGLAYLNYLRVRQVPQLARLLRFYESGIARLEGNWSGKGVSGEEFHQPAHLYETDLNLFGEGSLFELLCTARTQAGRERLGSYLLSLPSRDETIARQQAVQELEPRADLREKISLLGKFSFLDCDWTPIGEWLQSPAITAPPVILIWILPLVGLALVLMILIPWLAQPEAGLFTRVAPYVGPLILLQLVFAMVLRPRVRPVLEITRRAGQELTLLRQGLALLESQKFTSPKLKDLVTRVQGGRAAVRYMERLLRAMEECNKQWFFALSRVLLIDTQVALAMERWKARHGAHLIQWLDAWAEFEALNSLGCYAHEHPDDVFPEIVADAVEIEASGLGHPLLRESACVRNDVSLNAKRKFYLVSGSNMAGKSTFLRTIAINAVLGAAGAPVRARSARMSSFAVCASVSIVDSLGEGKSKFMAEIDRLRAILDATAGPKPVLFVIDEVLAGTNSRDRRVATESFMRALIAKGAIGALSTHDLALAEIANDPALCGLNVHMESRDAADPFAFDYLLKPGVSTHSNALAIARMAGVAV